MKQASDLAKRNAEEEIGTKDARIKCLVEDCERYKSTLQELKNSEKSIPVEEQTHMRPDVEVPALNDAAEKKCDAHALDAMRTLEGHAAQACAPVTELAVEPP